MNLFATSPEWLIAILLALLAAAASQDAVQLRISNAITAAVFGLALIAMAVAGFRIESWQNLVTFVLVLGFGTLLFSRGVLGGGDAKLLAAVGLWADFSAALLLVAAILICGGLLALVILFLRVAVPDRFARAVAVLQPGAGIPYGVAIALGTAVAITLLL